MLRVQDATVRQSAQEGRHLVAEADLDVDHVLFNGEAYVVACYDEYITNVCARCHAIDNSLKGFQFSCAACERAYYCSAECKRAHKFEGGIGTVAHERLCPALQMLSPLLEHGGLVKARLLIEVLARRHAQDAHEATSTDFRQLQYHCPLNGWNPDGLEEVDAWCNSLRRALAACDWASSIPEAELTDDSIFQIADQIDTNGFDARTLIMGGDSIGIGVYLGGATLFNHSCVPNCEIVHALPKLTIRTIRAVALGEALTISYIDVAAPEYANVRDRRERLEASYNFFCKCPRCEAEGAVAPPEPAVSIPAPPTLLYLHQHGAHYMVASAIAPFTGWGALLWLLVYFFVFVKVCNYQI